MQTAFRTHLGILVRSTGPAACVVVGIEAVMVDVLLLVSLGIVVSEGAEVVVVVVVVVDVLRVTTLTLL